MYAAQKIDHFDVFTQPVRPIHILAVEDDPFSMNFLTEQISALGYNLMKAENGEAALALLRAHRNTIDVVLMDREMPVMDGLTAVRYMKDDPDLRHIPVVMVTSADTATEMRQGLEAGVFYYLAKPVKDDVLQSVVSAAVRDVEQTKTLHDELGRHKASFELIDTCKFRFRTLSEAESLAAFMANCFPDPNRVITGLGELLINAVEHGNLAVGYERKSQLIANGIWRSEITRLQQMPDHATKYVEAAITHKPEGTYAVITDQGKGFNWRQYLRIDPVRASDNHGRGIAQAAAISFDNLTFNEAGNQVVGFVNRQKTLEW